MNIDTAEEFRVFFEGNQSFLPLSVHQEIERSLINAKAFYIDAADRYNSYQRCHSRFFYEYRPIIRVGEILDASGIKYTGILNNCSYDAIFCFLDGREETVECTTAIDVRQEKLKWELREDFDRLAKEQNGVFNIGGPIDVFGTRNRGYAIKSFTNGALDVAQHMDATCRSIIQRIGDKRGTKAKWLIVCFLNYCYSEKDFKRTLFSVSSDENIHSSAFEKILLVGLYPDVVWEFPIPKSLK